MTNSAANVMAHLRPVALRVPTATIARGRDFPQSKNLLAYPDLPILCFATEDISSDELSHSLESGLSIGTGGIPVRKGYLGTIRIQCGAHQAYLVVNPRDVEVRAMFNTWRSVGKIGIAWESRDNKLVLVQDFEKSMGQHLDKVGLTKGLSSSDFVEHAFPLIATGMLAAQATSDIPEHFRLASANAFLLATKAVSMAADKFVAKMRQDFAASVRR